MLGGNAETMMAENGRSEAQMMLPKKVRNMLTKKRPWQCRLRI
jgi:hypothetical protein